MKTVFFIRHAKSSWENPALLDSERPLNKRGKRDAPFMAKLLSAKACRPGLVLCSSSRRTQDTCRFFMKALDISNASLIISDNLYHASPNAVLNEISNVENDVETILLFGHNPTMTFLANKYSSTFVDNVPTCGILMVDFSIDNWSEVGDAQGVLSAFYYPKEYLP